MSTAPRITVIIPCLNQDLYLERAICSVLDQGYENLELIVMDGGSHDQSIEVIRTYENDLDHWQSDWDSGPAEAINTALTWATGDLVAVLDADDTYLPHALDEAARAFANEKTGWVVGQGVRVDDTDERLDQLPAKPARTFAGFLMDEAGPLPKSCVFYRTDLLKAMGGFDSGLKLAYTHEMHARLYAANQKPTVVHAALAAVRDHEENASKAYALTCGEEFVDAAERYATHLAPTHRYLLWRRHDETRRLYAAAAAEIADDNTRRVIWQQLMRRPAWLADNDYRRKLLKNLYPGEPVRASTDGPPQRRAA
ncbi:MAG: glycosyltransferase [Planctomycetota bacterium]